MSTVDLKAVAQKWVWRLNEYEAAVLGAGNEYVSFSHRLRARDLYDCLVDLGFSLGLRDGQYVLLDPTPQPVEQGGKGDE